MAITFAVVGWNVLGFFNTFVVFWLIWMFLGGWILKEVWKKGWVPIVRITEVAQAEPLRLGPSALESLGSRRPRPEPDPTPLPMRTPMPVAARFFVAGLGIATIGIAVALVLTTGDLRHEIIFCLAIASTVVTFAWLIKPAS